jgi:GT2 family glycosyltransferase
MAGDSMRIAVAIPTYNRGEVLLDTLRQVLAQEPRADEVLVVDQSERHEPEVRAALDGLQAAGEIRYFRQSPPNIAAARNRALREASCEVVIFIDDDVRLSPGFVAAHRRNYEADPAVVAVAGRVEQRLGWGKQRRLPSGRPEFEKFFIPLDGRERQEGVANFGGANHSIVAAKALGWGGYDERFSGVALREETDLALRVYYGGGKIVFDPSASLFHLSVPAGGCRPRSIYDLSAAQALLLFAFKHARFLRSATVSEVWLALRLSALHKAAMKSPRRIPVLLVLFVCVAARSAFRAMRG